MCGILGVFHNQRNDSLDRLIDAGLHNISHRGPDSNGVVAFKTGDGVLNFGHTRLSIIDLTSGGHQPMRSQDSRYAIVFNGEIYNYKELRLELQEQGYSFTSDSDTEVLLAAWVTWGANCLRRLIGMFAFAVFDRQNNTLTCVRDAFGIKPFFYAQEDGCFFFASEVPAILALRPSKPNPNWQRAYDYLVHGVYDSKEQTFFEGVHQLQPGHLLVVNLGQTITSVIQRWWMPKIIERLDLSIEEAAEQVRENFLQSIRLHLRSDVLLGAALSGGVDSSAVVCAMRHVLPDQPIHTFSYIASSIVSIPRPGTSRPK